MCVQSHFCMTIYILFMGVPPPSIFHISCSYIVSDGGCLPSRYITCQLFSRWLHHIKSFITYIQSAGISCTASSTTTLFRLALVQCFTRARPECSSQETRFSVRGFSPVHFSLAFSLP